MSSIFSGSEPEISNVIMEDENGEILASPHLIIQNNEVNLYRKYMFRSLNPGIVYIISIIDYLQLYNFSKYLETNIKFYIKSRPANIEEISSVPPDVYCARFINYVKNITKFDLRNSLNVSNE